MLSSRSCRMVVLSLGIACIGVGEAHAKIKSAVRGKFWSTVVIEDKDNMAFHTIWQSDMPAGNNYVNTAFFRQGNGKVYIPNIASGALLPGYNVKIGDDNNPGGQNPKIVTVGLLKWILGSVTPGPNTSDVVVSASASDQDGDVFHQTWEAGTTLAFTLPIGQASWTALSGADITNANLSVSLAPQRLEVQILSNSTTTELHDLIASNVEMNVTASIGSFVDMGFEYQGSSKQYINGVFDTEFFWSEPQHYIADRIPVVPAPSAATMLAGCTMIAVRRRR